jgi:hypothetical protein
MAEDQSELAIKAFGVIPFAFFDLIARVAPGMLLLFGADWVSDHAITPAIMEALLPNKALQESPIAWLIVALLAGYVLGQLMSPIVKPLTNLRKKEPEKDQQPIDKAYDNLRSRHPSQTPIVMRIRAEYIMFAGFAVAIALTMGVAGVVQSANLLKFGCDGWWKGASLSQHFTGLVLITSASIALVLMLNRSWETKQTFENSVRNVLKANNSATVTQSNPGPATPSVSAVEGRTKEPSL